MPTVRNYPTDLADSRVLDPRVYRRLVELYDLIYALQATQAQLPQQTVAAVQQRLQLLGVLREPLVGQEVADPQLAAAAQSPGTGTVVSVTVAGDPSNGLNSSGSPITGSGTITLTFGNSLNVATGYKVATKQVVGAQGAAIPDAAGGATIDAEARTALNALLAFFRNWGSIAP